MASFPQCQLGPPEDMLFQASKITMDLMLLASHQEPPKIDDGV